MIYAITISQGDQLITIMRCKNFINATDLHDELTKVFEGYAVTVSMTERRAA